MQGTLLIDLEDSLAFMAEDPLDRCVCQAFGRRVGQRVSVGGTASDESRKETLAISSGVRRWQPEFTIPSREPGRALMGSKSTFDRLLPLCARCDPALGRLLPAPVPR
jgi:hypothetical protein